MKIQPLRKGINQNNMILMRFKKK